MEPSQKAAIFRKIFEIIGTEVPVLSICSLLSGPARCPGLPGDNEPGRDARLPVSPSFYAPPGEFKDRFSYIHPPPDPPTYKPSRYISTYYVYSA